MWRISPARLECVDGFGKELLRLPLQQQHVLRGDVLQKLLQGRKVWLEEKKLSPEPL